MNIYQGCIIDLLERHGYVPDYVDSHQIDTVTYYFGSIGGLSIQFTRSCVPADVALEYLELFSLQSSLHSLQSEKCWCDW